MLASLVRSTVRQQLKFTFLYKCIGKLDEDSRCRHENPTFILVQCNRRLPDLFPFGSGKEFVYRNIGLPDRTPESIESKFFLSSRMRKSTLTSKALAIFTINSKATSCKQDKAGSGKVKSIFS
jgi:hypothetical protein